MTRARKETLPVTIDTPVYAARIVELGDNFSVAFETIRQEMDTAPIFRGLPDDRCPCTHWGVVVSGRMTMSYAGHDETWEAGDVFYVPPGHLPRSSAGTEVITFSPTDQLNEVNAVVQRNTKNLIQQT